MILIYEIDIDIGMKLIIYFSSTQILKIQKSNLKKKFIL